MRRALGFIGLGVMGEGMCRNLARKSGVRVVAYDVRPEPLKALAAGGVGTAASAEDVVSGAGTIFLCLPGEPQVRAVCLGAGGVVERLGPSQTPVDASTSPVALAQPARPPPRGALRSRTLPSPASPRPRAMAP